MRERSRWVIVLVAMWAGRGDAEPRELTLVTYNVLADVETADERFPTLSRLLDESDADVIALQEVARWFMDRIEREPWPAREGYRWVEVDRERTTPSGQAILTRLAIVGASSTALPGDQKRHVMVATLDRAGERLVVATTHLESPRGASQTRARQLEVIGTLLDGSPEAVLMGDLNFNEGDALETSRLPAGLVDVWLATRRGDPGFTWNVHRSELAARGSGPADESGRIDRILVRSQRWKPVDAQLLGDRPIEPSKLDRYPSDHFGVRARLRAE